MSGARVLPPRGTSSATARTVLRGGYGRTYGRLNGVDLVLVPLLGTGLIQPVQCFNALSNGNLRHHVSQSDQRVPGWYRRSGGANTGGEPQLCPSRFIPA